MRIVSWNSGGAFHRKQAHLAALEPDVAIVVECCQPERVKDLGFTSSAWIGRLHYKGLGVFGFGDYRVDQRPMDDSLEWVLPVNVTGPASLLLVAVWAMNRRATSHPERFAAMTQPEALIDALRLESMSGPVVVAGDFNNNPVWDTPRQPTFQRTNERFRDAGLVSLYHLTTGEPHGGESQPTHWWRDRTVDGPTYHIDYAWASRSIAATATMRVGTYEESVTRAGSDHAALIIDLETSNDSSG